MAAPEGTLRKVHGLLEKANGTDNEHEKQAFFAKADELMRRYSIDEFTLASADPKKKDKVPTIRDFDMDVQVVSSKMGKKLDHGFNQTLARLFREICHHLGIRIVTWGYSRSKVVGWDEDLEFASILFTSLKVDLLANMQPKWDPDLEDGENFHNLKSAGMKWQDIWDARQRALHDDPADYEPWQRNKATRWSTVYKKWCDDNEVRGQTSSALGSYREDFGIGYVNEVARRFRAIRDAREKETEGVGLVLADRKDKLTAFMDEHFPPPKTRAGKVARSGSVARQTRQINHSAMAAGRERGSRADIGQTKIGG